VAATPHSVEFIDSGRYPLHDPGLAAYAALLVSASGEYRETGCCVLPGFVMPGALAQIVVDCDTVASLGFRQPARRGPLVVPYDVIPLASPLRRLYEWDAVTRLVAGVIGAPAVFRSADPLGALNIDVMTEGDELAWHLDRDAVSVVLVIQDAIEGGGFEYLLPSDEDAEDIGINPLIAGDTSARLCTDAPAPGALMIFDGRRLLHHVTAVHGPRPRYRATFAYDFAPGAAISDAERLDRYGRLPSPGRRG